MKKNEFCLRRFSGFTLIELLLYISLSSIILLASSAMFIQVLTSSQKDSTLRDMEYQSNFVLTQMLQSIRNATGVNTPTVNTSGTSLSLAVSVPANSPTVYALSGGMITIQEGAGAVRYLTGDSIQYTSLVFYNYSNTSTEGSVRIVLTGSYVNPDGRNELNYTKTYYGTASLTNN